MSRRPATANEVCDAIKHKLAAFDDLRATATEPDMPNFPIAYPQLVDAIVSDFDGDPDYTLDIWVGTSLQAGLGSAESQLRAYLSLDGNKSITAALESEPTLGGTVKNLWVQNIGSTGRRDLAGVVALMGNVRVQVFA